MIKNLLVFLQFQQKVFNMHNGKIIITDKGVFNEVKITDNLLLRLSKRVSSFWFVIGNDELSKTEFLDLHGHSEYAKSWVKFATIKLAKFNK